MLGGDLLVLDDAGHCPQVTRPERMNAVLAAFAPEHGGTRTSTPVSVTDR